MDDEIRDHCALPLPIPILFINGTEDQAFPWDGSTRDGRRRLSVKETLAAWRALDGCSDASTVDTLPDLHDDGTRVWEETWSDCAGAAALMFFGVEGGGHTWPSGPGPFPPGRTTQEICSKEILDFLGRHHFAGGR